MKCLIIFIFILIIVVFTGCNEFEDKHWFETNTYVGSLPHIEDVKLYIDGELLEANEGYIGEEVTMELSLRDPDKNIVSLYADFYKMPDQFDALYTNVYSVPTSDEETFNVLLENQPHTISGPAGYWKILLYAVDSAGNESFEYEINFLVKE